MIFADLPKGARFRLPGDARVWTKLHKERAATEGEERAMHGFEQVEPVDEPSPTPNTP